MDAEWLTRVRVLVIFMVNFASGSKRAIVPEVVEGADFQKVFVVTAWAVIRA